MTAQPNQGFIVSAPAASKIRHRPCCLGVGGIKFLETTEAETGATIACVYWRNKIWECS